MKILYINILILLLLQNLGFGGSNMVENELLVRFEDGLTQADIEVILLDDPLEIVRQISRPLNLWLLRVDLQKATLHRVQRNMEEFPEIRYVQNDHFLSLRNIPDDPLYPQQWNFNNTGFDIDGNPSGIEDADIDAPEAWDISTGGTTALGRVIVAAVVDGGCEMSHPDLLANFWSNPADTAGNGEDDDGNGWVDDSLGWNAFNQNGDIPTSSHGTHVAGIIGAHSNNGNQVAGINWNVKLMIVAGASTLTSTAMEAYSYILEQKLAWLESGGTRGAFVVVTNSSFGIDFSDSANVCESGEFPVWNDMFNLMGEAGILSIAATANRSVNVDLSGDIPTSCNSPYLITVTNTTRSDVKTGSAGYGAESIDLGAPGYGILSTNYEQGVSTKYGTSMSAPHVTGAVALMYAAANENLSQYTEAHPGLGAQLIKSMLLSSVDTLAALQNITLSGGRLNLHQAALQVASWSPGGDGDLNMDGQVNIQDVVLLINFILGRIESTPELRAAADLNSDSNVTVQDLVFLVNVILQ